MRKELIALALSAGILAIAGLGFFFALSSPARRTLPSAERAGKAIGDTSPPAPPRGTEAPAVGARLPAASGPGGAAEEAPGALLGISISGVVLDAGGRPARGVRVAAQPEHSRRRRLAVPAPIAADRAAAPPGPSTAVTSAAVTSAEDGSFTLHVLGPGTYRVLARRDSPPAACRVLALAGEGGIELRLEEMLLLRGRVILAGGGPVEGARVQASLTADRRKARPGAWDEAAGAAVMTDAAGEFTLEDLEPGVHDIRVTGEGIREKILACVRVEAATAGPIEIRVEPGLSLGGKVIHGEETPEAPAPGLEVLLERIEKMDGAVEAAVVTDSGGRFASRALSPGPHRIIVKAPPPYLEAVLEPVEAGAEDVLIALARGALVAGRVIDGSSAAPLTDSVVRLKVEGLGPVEEARTDPEGRFRFAVAANGRGIIEAASPGFFASRLGGLEVSPGSPIDGLELRLERAGSVSGKVMDPAGLGVEGAVVTLDAESTAGVTRSSTWGGPAATAPDGSFRLGLEKARAGATYRLSVEGPGGYLEKGLEVRIDDPREHLTGLDLTLRPGGSLATTVTSGGCGVHGAKVDVFRIEGAEPGADPARGGAAADGPLERLLHVGEATAAPGGGFRLGGLIPARYRLFVEARGFARRVSPPIDVLEGRESAHEVILEPEAAIEGDVRDAAGSPIPGAIITAMDPRGSRGDPRAEAADREGKFRLRSLAPGAYDLLVEADGFAPSYVRGLPAGEPARVVLTRTSSIEGRVADAASGRAVGEFKARLFPERAEGPAWSREFRDAAGILRAPGLPAGDYRLLVTAPGYLPREAPLRLVPDETAAVEVLLEAGNAVEGSVAGADGTAIEGADLSAVRLVEERAASPGTAPPGRDEAPRLVPFEGTGSSAERPRSRSDRSGTFRISGLEDGMYRIEARHPDHGSAAFEPVRVRSGEPVGDVRLRLGRGE